MDIYTKRIPGRNDQVKYAGSGEDPGRVVNHTGLQMEET